MTGVDRKGQPEDFSPAFSPAVVAEDTKRHRASSESSANRRQPMAPRTCSLLLPFKYRRPSCVARNVILDSLQKAYPNFVVLYH
jgi:hypothetical protein